VLLAFGAVAVNTALKTLFGPTQLYADAVGSTESVNFPSGHVAYATALFGFFAFLGLERRRAEVVVVSLLLIVAMGPARIISGAHFPSDVVGGYLVGAAWLCGVVLWTTRR
jgi:undecaprenyl-diphosphatase